VKESQADLEISRVARDLLRNRERAEGARLDQHTTNERIKITVAKVEARCVPPAQRAVLPGVVGICAIVGERLG
jgi:hypothetical protein